MMLDLDKLESICNAATQGPWSERAYSKVGAMNGAELFTTETYQHTSKFSGPKFIGHIFNRADAKYMVAISPDVTIKLINKIRELKEALNVEDLVIKTD